MFRRKDIIIILAILLIAAAAYGVMMLGRSRQTLSGAVRIQAEGALYATASLDEDQEITVTQANGDVNIVKIERGAVSMAYSSCKNQLCLHQGEITAENWTRRSLGRSIVCLPNSVLVELTLDEGHPSLGDPDAPDI